MKKLLSLILSVAIIICAVPFGALTFSVSAATSGRTGNCTWELNGTVLTISGNGNMADYPDYYKDNVPPWHGSQVTEVILKDGVTRIGERAFYGCDSLVSVKLPRTLISIGAWAFSGSPDAYYEGSWTEWQNVDVYPAGNFFGNFIYGDPEILMYSYNQENLTASVVDCAEFAETVNIPKTVVKDERTYTVTSVCAEAFVRCEMTSVIIPDGVTTIGLGAFGACLALTDITIPASVTSIGDYAFQDCANLTKVYYGGNQTQASKISIGVVNDKLTNATWYYESCISSATHTYDNTSDIDCNKCGYKRDWKISVTKTGVYNITLGTTLSGFNKDSITIFDDNGSVVKYNDSKKGWPLVAGGEYTIKLNEEFNYTSDLDWTLTKKSDSIFQDTDATAWYNDAVTYSVGAGIITGYGGTNNFGTADKISRHDFVVILARFAGIDLSVYDDAEIPFKDVADNQYYTNAILWAAESGITSGYTSGVNAGKFGVGDEVTREQLVTFLYRYASNINGSAPEVSDDAAEKAAAYPDFAAVGSYATEAVIWALDKGVISGQGGTHIAPGGNAIRCEVAKIFYNIYLNDIFVSTTPVCDHTYTEATCTEPKTCTKCQKTIGFPTAHSYSEANCITPKTCENCGRVSNIYGDHSFADATCTEPATCIYCGDTQGNKLGHNYVLGECTNVNNGQLCGDYNEEYCPKLYFTGDMSKITDPNQRDKKIECDISFEYRSREQIKTGAAKIKIQGSSSTQYAKKNYTINFYEDENYSSKQKIDVGWGAQSKYCLKANWIDKTHSRNIVTANLGAQMQAKYDLFTSAPHNGTIDGFPVEIYINGEFHGLYTMNIPKDEWMFGMDKNNPDHIVICGENWNDPVLFKSIPTDLKDWTVEAGPEDDATLQKVQRLVKFVKDSSDAEFEANFNQYLDFDSTINYYVMMNCAWLSDNSGKNMLLATYDGKVWYPTLYDLDTSWGTNWRGDGTYNYGSGVINGSNSLLWQRVEKLYKKEIAARYFELRKDVLSKENIMSEFNNFKTSIPKEVLDREIAKWNTDEHPIPGYDISQIEEYLNIVLPRLDNRFNEWK